MRTRNVCNLMTLNDRTEKDNFELQEMRRIVDARVGSNFRRLLI